MGQQEDALASVQGRGHGGFGGHWRAVGRDAGPDRLPGTEKATCRRPRCSGSAWRNARRVPETSLDSPTASPDRVWRSAWTSATACKASRPRRSLGDYFQYVIDRPVDLARQKSALLPIVNKDVEGKRVSIYNQSVQAKHPLLGLHFKNTTGMPLTQGPITVFEGSVYAGDTRVLDLQPNEERLVSYAIDLGTEVSVKPGNSASRITRSRPSRASSTRTPSSAMNACTTSPIARPPIARS